MKKFTVMLLCAAMLLGTITGCGNKVSDDVSSSKTQEPIQIRIAHNDTESETNAYHYTALRMKELIEERTDGSVTVQIYPNGQYGGEREMFEATILGTVDIAIMTSGNIGEFSKAFLAVDLPFAFSSSEAAWEALDGPAGQAIGGSLSDIGITGLAWGENGFRNMVTNGHGIRTADDFKGMKVRALENELHVNAYKSWGANPSPLAWAEVMTGLQQGTIQGLDIPISVAYSNNFSDLADYYSLTNQFYNAQYVVCNSAWLDELSPELQETVKQAALDACNMERKWLKENEMSWLNEMEANGMEIIREDAIDYESFKAKVAGIYDEYAEKIGGTYVYDLLEAAEKKAE